MCNSATGVILTDSLELMILKDGRGSRIRLSAAQVRALAAQLLTVADAHEARAHRDGVPPASYIEN